MAAANTVSFDTLITIKLQTGNETRRFKLPLKDLVPNVLPLKLRTLLAIPEGKDAVFERYSDSAGNYVKLDDNNVSVYKQLNRAAKAKLKLRIRATVSGDAIDVKSEPEETPKATTSESFNPVSSPVDPPLPPAPKPAPKSLPIPPFAYAHAQMQSLKAQLDAQAQMQQAQIKSLEQNSTIPYCRPPQYKTNIIPPRFKMTAEEPSNMHGEKTTRDDYQMQLMLLEQQNKKRLLMARAEQDALRPSRQEQAAFASVSPKIPQQDSERSEQPKASQEEKPKGPFGGPCAQFSVCCNNCNGDIPGAHWHCSICSEGDYDLCPKCVESGQHCWVDHHFLIKRHIENGRVINSTHEPYKQAARVENFNDSETDAMLSKPAEPESNDVQGAYTEPTEEVLPEEICRTCNACVNVFEENQFVTCLECDDYDLCFTCHKATKHGHHPGHTFEPVNKEITLAEDSEALLAAGRNTVHAAICDGCDKSIIGVRNKCLTCPDWDYCSTCAKSAHIIHPGHRMVKIYEPVMGPLPPRTIHFGIRCDGPLCKTRSRQSFIVGDRYKCAVCHDTDFCANCEALPTNSHNRTHPLIKFRTPVRNCSVTTYGDKDSSEVPVTMGDRLPQTSSKSTETTPAAPSANAATQVQTVAELKPVEIVKEAVKIESARASPAIKYQAHFIKDQIADGTRMVPGQVFEQVWTLRNPGPHAWPAGCGLRFTGGDRMLNIDEMHPSSVSELDKAVSSNTIDHDVEVNEEVSFAATLRAPTRLGNAISYWRVKSPDGNAFGHRLWCEIKVEAAPAPATPIKSKEVEETKSASESVSVEELRQSQMIFPTLEKESPYSSVHDDSSQGQTAPSTVSADAPDFFDDVESLEIDDDSTDDGFLTDEEYDILDNESEFSAANNGRI